MLSPGGGLTIFALFWCFRRALSMGTLEFLSIPWTITSRDKQSSLGVEPTNIALMVWSFAWSWEVRRAFMYHKQENLNLLWGNACENIIYVILYICLQGYWKLSYPIFNWNRYFSKCSLVNTFAVFRRKIYIGYGLLLSLLQIRFEIEKSIWIQLYWWGSPAKKKKKTSSIAEHTQTYGVCNAWRRICLILSAHHCVAHIFVNFSMCHFEQAGVNRAIPRVACQKYAVPVFLWAPPRWLDATNWEVSAMCCMVTLV